MKYVEISKVPKGANVLMAEDNGTGSVTKEDEIDLYVQDEDGTIELAYEDSRDVIIRVRCANEIGGYWKPVEVRTKDIEPGETHYVEMKEDKYLIG